MYPDECKQVKKEMGDKYDDTKLNINVLIVLFTKKEEKPFRF